MHISINYLAVLVAAVVAFVLGAIWNGPLFGKAAAAARGAAAGEGSAMPSPGTMAIIFVALLLAAFGLAAIASYVHLFNWTHGLKLGALAGICFMLPAVLIDHQMSRGTKTAALWIGAGSWLVSCIVMGVIVTVWR